MIYYLNALGNTLDWSHQKVLKNNPQFEFVSAGDHEGVTEVLGLGLMLALQNIWSALAKLTLL